MVRAPLQMSSNFWLNFRQYFHRLDINFKFLLICPIKSIHLSGFSNSSRFSFNYDQEQCTILCSSGAGRAAIKFPSRWTALRTLAWLASDLKDLDFDDALYFVHSQTALSLISLLASIALISAADLFAAEEDWWICVLWIWSSWPFRLAFKYCIRV